MGLHLWHPSLGTSSASLDSTGHHLGNQGQGMHSNETQAFLLVSARFFVFVCCWVVSSVARVSWGSLMVQQNYLSGSLWREAFPLTLFFSHLSTQKHSQGLHHTLHDQPFLPNEHWDQCTEAEEDIQQHHDATSAPSMIAQSLNKRIIINNSLNIESTMLLTLQNSSPPYEVITIK